MKNKTWSWISAAAQFGIIVVIVHQFFHPNFLTPLISLPVLGYLWGCADQKKRRPPPRTD